MRWRVLAVAAVVAPALPVIAAAVFCNATLHVRRKLPEPLGNAAEVWVTARDGVTLRASFVQPSRRAGRCVMVLHGIGDSRSGSAGFAPPFLQAGYSVLLPDSRAHGTSGGDLVTYGVLERYDVLKWTDWMSAHGCTALYGLGESLGAATLIQACAVAPAFRAVVAEGSYSDLRSIGAYRTQGMTGAFGARLLVSTSLLFARARYGLDFDRASPREAISRSQVPILLVHGLADDLTPPSHSIALNALNRRGALWLVPRAGHTAAAAASPDEFWRRVFRWFEDH